MWRCIIMKQDAAYKSIEQLEENEYYRVPDLPVGWYIAVIRKQVPDNTSNLLIIRTGAGLDKQNSSVLTRFVDERILEGG
jgi:hypothetical protein